MTNILFKNIIPEFKKNMRVPLNIFLKDLNAFIYSPIAYIVTTIFLVVSGWFFFSRFFIAGQVELRLFFGLLPLIYVFFIPAMTTRLFSEEFNVGSYEILLTLPVRTEDVVIGKFFAGLVSVCLMTAPTLAYVISVLFLGDLDFGPVIGGYLGIIFLGGAFVSIGIFASALTRNQIVAFITGVSITFVLFLIDKVLIFFPAKILTPLQYLSADYHFQNIAKGIIDSRDLLYFLSVMVIFNYAAKIVLDKRR